MFLESGTVHFYAAMDVRGPWLRTHARFDVELRQNGEVVGRASCDPFRRNTRRTCVIMTPSILECSMATTCEIDLARAGQTLVRAQLTAPIEVDVQRADLLVGHR